MKTEGRFWPPGDIWQCLETSLVVTTEGEGASGISQVEAKDASKPTMHRRVPHNKSYLATHASNAEAEEAGPRERSRYCQVCGVGTKLVTWTYYSFL